MVNYFNTSKAETEAKQCDTQNAQGKRGKHTRWVTERLASGYDIYV